MAAAEKLPAQHLSIMCELLKPAGGWRARSVDAVLDSQDRLDELTDRREKLLGRADKGPSRAVNVHGEELQIDALARGFWIVGQDTSYDK